MSIAVVGAVVAGMISARPPWLGYLIQQAEGVFDVAGVFVADVRAAVFVILIDDRRDDGRAPASVGVQAPARAARIDRPAWCRHAGCPWDHDQVARLDLALPCRRARSLPVPSRMYWISLVLGCMCLPTLPSWIEIVAPSA